jgi:hypothetical protein
MRKTSVNIATYFLHLLRLEGILVFQPPSYIFIFILAQKQVSFLLNV